MPKNAHPLAFLLTLNLTLAAKEKADGKITPPGLPLPAAEQAAFKPSSYRRRMISYDDTTFPFRIDN